MCATTNTTTVSREADNAQERVERMKQAFADMHNGILRLDRGIDNLNRAVRISHEAFKVQMD